MTSLFRCSILLCALLLLSTLVSCSEDSVTPPLPLLTGPGAVSYGDVAIGVCKDTSIRYDNTTGKTITLTSATFSGAGFEWTGETLPVDVAAGSSIDLKVRFCPVGKDSASVTLIFKGKGGSDVSIKLTGNGLDLRPLVTGPASINFGTVGLNDCKDTTIRYDNTSGKSVVITDFEISGSNAAAFQGVGTFHPNELAPGESIDIKVRFCPSTEDSVTAVLMLNGTGGQAVLIALSGKGSMAAASGPKVGNTYLYDLFETDDAGTKVPGSETTVEDEIIDAGVTYEGKSNVFIVSEGGALSYYALESNGDISVYLDAAQGGPLGSVIAGWKTLPYGSERTNVVLLSKDTSITYQGAQVTAKIKQTASYAGTTTVKIGSTTFDVKNVTLLTTVDLLAGGLFPVGRITNTVQAGFIPAIGYQANFDSQLASTVPGITGGGSRKKLRSFVLK